MVNSALESTTIWLVRHGEAEGNITHYFQGHIDCPLTEAGHKQAEFLAARFQQIPYHAIYSSPLKRAAKTAEIINAGHGKPLGYVNGLLEIRGGKFEGVPWSELPVRFPEAFYCWREKPAVFAAPEGETMTQVYRRVSETVCWLARRHQGQTLILVSHGCALRTLLCWARGWPVERIGETEWADNTAVSCVRLTPSGKSENGWRWKREILLENDTAHLPAGASLGSASRMWEQEAVTPEKGRT